MADNGAAGDVGADSPVVVVANRLPVDQVTDPDGSTRWQRSPGGLVTALEPFVARPRRRLGRLVRLGRRGAGALRVRRHVAGPGRARPRTRSTATTRACPTRTLWPLYHDVVEQAGVPPRVVGRLRAGQPALRRARPRRVAAEGAIVWVHDYQLQLVPAMLRELRPDLRIGFFLHIPFPPAELFPQLPWRRPDPRGAARRRPGRLPAARRRRPTSSGWCAARLHKTCRRPRSTSARRPHRAAPRPSRSPSTSPRFEELAAVPRRAQRGPRRSARASATRRRSSSASTGSTTPRASTSRLRAFAGAARRRRARRRATPCSCRSRPRAASGSSSTCTCARRSSGMVGHINGDFGSDRPAGRSATSTSRCRARRWPRSTAPPTSWWSRPTATA